MNDTRYIPALIFVVLLNVLSLELQAGQFEKLLNESLVSEFEVHHQHHEYVRKRMPKLKLASTAKQWAEEAQILRERILENVVYQGIPESWRDFKPTVVLADNIVAEGYAIQKLRYEALPGFWIPALLYIPESVLKNPNKKVPVVLNVNGHDGQGKAAVYKQKRCIHLAKHGVLNLNVEWLGMGQFRDENYKHSNLKKLDLCGCSGLSLFYFSMSRGLDVLLQQPSADSKRIGVTGLSGGGWQTIFISSLDTRVTLCVPVAGYSSLISRLARPSDIGDQEQLPVDLLTLADYTHLTALLVPRPALLIYNEKDNCCFISKFIKPNTYEPIVPFYRQAGVPENFQYYENSDPGTHNYYLDNRNQLYRFLNRHFFSGETVISVENKDDHQVYEYDELVIEIPKGNAGFNYYSKEIAQNLPIRNGMSEKHKRTVLKEILKIKKREVTVSKIKTTPLDSGGNLMQLTLDFDKELRLPVVVLTPVNATKTVLLISDDGYSGLSNQVKTLIQEKVQVVLCDPIYIGQNKVKGTLYQQQILMTTIGERPLGIQAQQVLELVRSLPDVIVHQKVELRGIGVRSSLIALCAAALDENEQLTGIVSDDCPKSLKELLKPGVKVNSYPEFYTFGLLKYFDIADLKQLAN